MYVNLYACTDHLIYHTHHQFPSYTNQNAQRQSLLFFNQQRWNWRLLNQFLIALQIKTQHVTASLVFSLQLYNEQEIIVWKCNIAKLYFTLWWLHFGINLWSTGTMGASAQQISDFPLNSVTGAKKQVGVKLCFFCAAQTDRSTLTSPGNTSKWKCLGLYSSWNKITRWAQSFLYWLYHVK